jgi:hypothetical protein
VDLVLAVCYSCTIGMIVWSVRLHLPLNQHEVGDREDPEGFLGMAGQGTTDPPFYFPDQVDERPLTF